MKGINLIPQPRRDARKRRTHLHRCAAALGCYAALLAGGCIATLMIWGGGDRTLDEQLNQAAAEIEESKLQAAAHRTEILSAAASLAATRSVTNQPDWSTLLALLGSELGDEIVLRHVAVAPPFSNSGSNKQQSGLIMLETAGFARSQLAVSQYILRLEKMGLFANVSLLDSSRQPFLRTEAIAFRVQCVVGGSAIAGTDMGEVTR